VAHDPPRREAIEHGQAAHDRLADDAERQQRSEDGEVTPEGPAEVCESPGRDRGAGHEPREHPIPELDPGV
jgi:hypothetical protein